MLVHVHVKSMFIMVCPFRIKCDIFKITLHTIDPVLSQFAKFSASVQSMGKPVLSSKLS